MAITVLQGGTFRMLSKDKRVLDIDLGEEEKVIITTAHGFAFGPNADRFFSEHVRGFENWESARNAVRKALPCECGRCIEEYKP